MLRHFYFDVSKFHKQAFCASPSHPQWTVRHEFALVDLQLFLEAEKSETVMTYKWLLDWTPAPSEDRASPPAPDAHGLQSFPSTTSAHLFAVFLPSGPWCSICIHFLSSELNVK